MTTLGGKAIVSRVPSRGLFAMIRLLNIRRVADGVAVNFGLSDGGLKGGKVVGVTSGFFYSRRVGHVSIITPGIGLGVVHSCRMIRGGRMEVPSRLHKVIGYTGPGYVAGGRPVTALFRIASGSGYVMGYRCYRGRRGHRRVAVLWFSFFRWEDRAKLRAEGSSLSTTNYTNRLQGEEG